VEHADHYERHLPPRAGTDPVRILEIGVQSGGSVRAWRQWYGDRLRYTGVDIEPLTKRSHSPSENIFVKIGSQSDPTFMLSICDKYGPFDIVIDDGGHTPELIRASLSIIYPQARCMVSPRSLYVVEDTQTIAFRAYTKEPSDMFNLVGEAFHAMHYQYLNTYEGRQGRGGDKFKPEAHMHPFYRDLVAAVHAYPTIFFLTRARAHEITTIHRPIDVEGKDISDAIGYGQGEHHPWWSVNRTKPTHGGHPHVARQHIGKANGKHKGGGDHS